MADMDEELDSLFDDSSFNEGEMEDFLNMIDDDDSENLFADSDAEAGDIFAEDDDDGSSFMAVDMDAEETSESFAMTDDWNQTDEGSFTDIDNLFSTVEEEAPEPLPKKTVWQKIKSVFVKELSEEEKEQKKLEQETEEAEENEYNKLVSEEKAEKKKVKSEAKKVAKEEAAKKKEEQKAAKAAKDAAKKAEANKKKAEKAAKKAEKKGIPVPKSQIVPVAPIFVLIILGAAAAVVIVMGSSTSFYASSVKEAKELFIHQKYSKAYENLLGLDIKEKDQEFYEQVEVVNLVSDKLDGYYSYIEFGKYKEGLDSLLTGVRKYNENTDKAEKLGLMVEFQSIYSEILTQLNEVYGVSEQQANIMLNMTETNYHNQLLSLGEAAATANTAQEASE